MLSLAAVAGLVGFALTSLHPGQTSQARAALAAGACHPSYVGRCLPIVRDLDCAEVGGIVQVVGPDVYHLDRDGDGEGCEPLPR